MADLRQTLVEVRADGRRRQVHCPAHQDRQPSLSIGLGDDGRLLVHCHAGCPLDDVLRAAGLTIGDLFAGEKSTASQVIVAEYPYCDETGTHLYDAVRFAPKDFKARRADGEWTLRDVRRVLYRLSELQGQATAYVPEGEKDADRIRAIGLPATTGFGGAGKWRQDYVEQLVDAGVQYVVVLVDNDVPGRDHATQVAGSCHAAGLKVKVVALPGLPIKGDVSDWLDGGHTKRDLVAFVKTVPIFQPVPTSVDRNDRLDLVTLGDVAPEQIDWIWPGRVARRKYTLLSGDPGLGKSTLSLGIAAHLSNGSAWPDGGMAPQGRTLILSAEDGIADTMRPRFDRLGGNASQLIVLRAVRDERGTARPLNLAQDLGALAEAIRRVEPLLVIIDPITAYLGKTDSYKDAEVRGLLAPLLALLEEKNVALIAVGHLSKGEQRAALHRPGGSIAFVAAARVGLCLAADPEDADRRVLAGLKSNIGPLPSSLAFRLPEGALVWESGVVALDAEALLRPSVPGEREDRMTARSFMQELLDDDGRWPLDAKQAIKEAGERGIPERTMRRAANDLGVQFQREGFGKEGRSVWYRPSISAKSATPALSSRSVAGMAAMENPEHISATTISAIPTCTDVDDDDDFRA